MDVDIRKLSLFFTLIMWKYLQEHRAYVAHGRNRVGYCLHDMGSDPQSIDSLGTIAPLAKLSSYSLPSKVHVTNINGDMFLLFLILV